MTVKPAARPAPLRCEDCGLFIRTKPDWEEYEDGCDVEWEFGQEKYGGDIIRTPWRSLTGHTECRSCGWDNTRELEFD